MIRMNVMKKCGRISKRILAGVMAGCLMFSCAGYVSVPVVQAEGTVTGRIDGMNYEFFEDGTCTLIEGGYWDVVIPEKIEFEGKEYAVTSIGKEAFKYEYVKSISIPESVTSIGERAFYGCKLLSSITIPSSVISIGDSAFYKSESLTDVVISEGVTTIADYAFYQCTSLESISIPASVTSIESHAFYGCSNLSSVIISDGVKSIGSHAFYVCDALSSVSIPASVTDIGVCAFNQNISLNEIKVDENNLNYMSMDGVLYTKSGDTLITCPGGKTVVNEYPDDLTYIADQAFSYCSNLTSVTIPSGVTSIGRSAFWGCSSLATINLPSSLTEIKMSAFGGCSSLTSVEIPENVITIGDFCFRDCTSLTSVSIPAGVTSIGDYMFSCCTGLMEFKVDENNPKYMSMDGALYTKSGATLLRFPAGRDKVTEFHENLTEIGWVAFSSCEKITNITIPAGVESIGSEAFAGCSNLTSVTIPNSVRWLGTGVFSSCSSLISVTIPSGVKSIPENAFYCCSSLSSVTIPTSVKSICASAFNGCSSLTSVDIPASVESIEDYVFNGCSSLMNINVEESNVNYMSVDGVLYNKSGDTLLRYPAGKSEISGFHEKLETIYKYAFYGCYGITDVTIPDGVTDIGDYAFGSCINLFSINISDSVTTIGSDAFRRCSKLNSVIIPENVTSIGSSAFYDCANLACASVLNSAADIGTYAFCKGKLVMYGATDSTAKAHAKDSSIPFVEAKLASYYTDAQGVNYMLGDDGTCEVIRSIANLGKNIVIPEKITVDGKEYRVTKIGKYAFYYSDLESVIVSEGVTTIGVSAFEYCENLTKAVIPESVVNIEDYYTFYKTKVVIYGVVGSTAETYAKKKGYEFVEYKYDETEPTPIVSLTPTEEPTVSPFPTKQAEATVSPSPTKTVEVTVSPAPTKQVEITDAPTPTEMTDLTVSPLPTEASEVTVSPAPTKQLEATVSPIPTKQAEATVSPVPTKVTELATNPTPTEEPESTTTPAPTEEPESTMTPAPTESPDSTVTPSTVKVQNIALNKTTHTMHTGEKFALTATVSTENATDKTLTYKSSKPSVAAVDAKGKVTAKKPGTTVITVTANDGSGVTAICTIKVGYKIVYKLNGGKNNEKNPTVYTTSANVKLDSPSKEGYTFKGWYTTKKFKSNSKITKISKKSKGTVTVYAKWEKVKKPAKAVLGKAKINKSGTVTVTAKKNTTATGYQFILATDKKFKKNVKTITTKKTTTKFKDLKQGTTYYIKVGAYKTDSANKKIYGSYSKIKKLKVTK